MKIDVVKIASVIIPLLLTLRSQNVPKSKTNLYQDASQKCDLALDSLQNLAIKYKTEPESDERTLDEKNLKLGIDITEKTIEAYKERVEAIKRISGLYE